MGEERQSDRETHTWKEGTENKGSTDPIGLAGKAPGTVSPKAWLQLTCLCLEVDTFFVYSSPVYYGLNLKCVWKMNGPWEASLIQG